MSCFKQVIGNRYSVIRTDYHLFLFLIILALALTPQLALAHGGGVPFISNEPLGEFVASVWLDPDPLAAGQIHVTVGLAKEQSVVLNQVVQVQMRSQRGVVSEALATHEQATNRFFYEADFEFLEAGTYELKVSVEGQADQLSLADIVIQEPSWTRSPWVGGVALGIVAAIWLL
ncbi:MAG: hypothetical protein ACPG8W_11280, partial [Candidatus Promineifilaceae bacterium]